MCAKSRICMLYTKEQTKPFTEFLNICEIKQVSNQASLMKSSRVLWIHASNSILEFLEYDFGLAPKVAQSRAKSPKAV